MEPYEIALLIVFGFGIAFVTTIRGLGGGTFFVPLMVFLLTLPIVDAREISQFVILCAVLISAWTYLRQKRVYIKVGLVGAACSVCGSIVFKSFFSFLGNDIVGIVFGGFLLLLGGYYLTQVLMARRKKQQMKATVAPTQLVGNAPSPLNQSPSQRPAVDIGVLPNLGKRKWIAKTIPLFFAGGFLAAFFGVGGGILYVPTLNGLLQFPIHYSTATSSFIIFFTSLANVSVAGVRGQIDWFVGLFLAIGAVPGGRLGAKISERMPKDALKSMLGGLMLFIGGMMVVGI